MASPKFHSILEMQTKKKMRYRVFREVRTSMRTAKTRLINTTSKAKYASMVKIAWSIALPDISWLSRLIETGARFLHKWVLFLSSGHIPGYDERVRGRWPRLNFILSLYNLCKVVNKKLQGKQGDFKFPYCLMTISKILADRAIIQLCMIPAGVKWVPWSWGWSWGDLFLFGAISHLTKDPQLDMSCA